MMETTRSKNGGKHHFETREFLEAREETYRDRFGVQSPLQSPEVQRRRRATCQERYGVPHVSQDPNIAQRQREGFREKYGVDHFFHVPESRAKFEQTLQDKYGVPSLAHLSRTASRESQLLFWGILERIPETLREKCYFAEMNREFNVSFGGFFYKYDFVHSGLRKAIEYNGSRFHPRPDQHPEETGWCVFHPDRTVQEARDYEAHKYDALESRGFTIMTVWDQDLHDDLESLVERCVEFLLEEVH